MPKSNSSLRWQNGELYIGENVIDKKNNIPSSHGASPGSVISEYDTSRARPSQARTTSWPAVNDPTRERARYTTGYPSTLYGGASQGSAPIYDAGAHDHYREAIKPKPYNQGYPRNSRFNRLYNDYKDLDEAAQSSENDHYLPHRDSAKKPTPDQRRENPDLYKGKPRETEGWHRQGAEYAAKSKALYDE